MADQPTLGRIAYTAVIALLSGIVCFIALLTLGARAEKVRVKVPLVMSEHARNGKEIFDAKCRRCHGRNLSGTDKGPALILYGKAHHGDGVFFQAVRSGVSAHHWEFGDMPKRNNLTDDDIALIVRYVRELQKFNEKLNGND